MQAMQGDFVEGCRIHEFCSQTGLLARDNSGGAGQSCETGLLLCNPRLKQAWGAGSQGVQLSPGSICGRCFRLCQPSEHLQSHVCIVMQTAHAILQLCTALREGKPYKPGELCAQGDAECRRDNHLLYHHAAADVIATQKAETQMCCR